MRDFDRINLFHSLGALRLLDRTWTVHDADLNQDWKRVSRLAGSLVRSQYMEDEPTCLLSTNFCYYVT